jgi:hypothetical protein
MGDLSQKGPWMSAARLTHHIDSLFSHAIALIIGGFSGNWNPEFTRDYSIRTRASVPTISALSGTWLRRLLLTFLCVGRFPECSLVFPSAFPDSRIASASFALARRP